MARQTPYKIKRLQLPAEPHKNSIIAEDVRTDNPANVAGTEATQTPTTTAPSAKVIPPGQRIATTMEIRSQIADIMNRRDYHPIRELVEMVKAKRQRISNEGKPEVDSHGAPVMEFVYDADFRKSIHAELAPYIAPKLKAVDMQMGGQVEITISVVKFADRSRGEQAKQVNERIVDV